MSVKGKMIKKFNDDPFDFMICLGLVIALFSLCMFFPVLLFKLAFS